MLDVRTRLAFLAALLVGLLVSGCGGEPADLNDREDVPRGTLDVSDEEPAAVADLGVDPVVDAADAGDLASDMAPIEAVFEGRLSGGFWHTCAVLDRRPLCWGWAWDVFGWPTSQSAYPIGELTQVSAGLWHNCGLTPQGEAFCWGDAREGQTNAPGGAFAQISAGGFHSCGLRPDGDIECWGRTNEAPAGPFVQVVAGSRNFELEHDDTCGLRPDGRIECWSSSGAAPFLPPRGRFVQIALGPFHGCALRDDGEVECFLCANLECAAEASYGQQHAPAGPFVQVSAGSVHSCGLRPDGEITCWGHNGDDGRLDAPAGPFVAVTAGNFHTCGLRPDNRLECWGRNTAAQLELPCRDVTCDSPPDPLCEDLVHVTFEGSGRCDYWDGCLYDVARVELDCGATDQICRQSGCGQGFQQVVVGVSHSCALQEDDTIVCWGADSDNVLEAPDGRFTQLTARGTFTCALDGLRKATCWGRTRSGPIEPPADVELVSISAGLNFACGITGPDRELLCFGDDGDIRYRLVGLLDPPEGRFEQVSAGDFHACALRDDGTVACWGSDDSNEAFEPEGVFSSIRALSGHTCALDADVVPGCWGLVLGEPPRPPDVALSHLAGYGTTDCGVRADDGTVLCWTRSGELLTPVEGRFLSVERGNRHSCGLRPDGRISCWGDDSGGRLEVP